MARLIPSDIGRLELAGGHRPELETLRYLRDALPAAYTVFHGVHWSREYRGHTVYGEIDFAVLNRVLVDVDPDPAGLELEQRRLFCGMTRATVKLDLLVRASNPLNARLLDAGAGAVHDMAR